MKERGKKLAVASSTKLEQVRKNLARNGLDRYFDVVIGGDMIEASKPAPDIYLEACRRLSVSLKMRQAWRIPLTGSVRWLRRACWQ